MANDKLEDYSAAELTKDELRQVRRLLSRDAHSRWLWSGVKIWVMTIGTIGSGVVGLNLLYVEVIKKMLK